MAKITQVAAVIDALGDTTPWVKVDNFVPGDQGVTVISVDGGFQDYAFTIEFIESDNTNAQAHPVSLSATGGVITVKDNGPAMGGAANGEGLGHGLAAGDFVSLDDSQGLAGVYDVATVIDAFNYTLATAVATTIPLHIATARTGLVVPGPANQTSRSLSFLTVCTAVRLKCDTLGVEASVVARLLVLQPDPPR